jgi:sigma-B regulation protein RsbU (phosphoserine phosphatase)
MGAIIAEAATARDEPKHGGFFQGDWETRLNLIVSAMREMSLQDDPQEMVRAYAKRVRQLRPAGGWVSVSRRGLERPYYRITRSSRWTEEINPWKQRDRLPVLEGGLLGDLIYGNQPRLIDDITDMLADDDPAREYLEGFCSMMAVPHFDRGEAVNMVITLEREPGAFDPESFPEWVWVSSLFGRATHNLVLRDELKQAYEIVERELKVVADIQRSLLPQKLPEIPGLELAVYYQTSRWAGGDYYDFLPLPGGRWGVLIADVSGHGTPAAVMMAITHSVAHSLPGDPEPPGALLTHVNRQLCDRYTASNEVFVTAFYGIFDPVKRTLTYACAGHNPPRLRRCEGNEVIALEEVGGPPLGVFEGIEYDQVTLALEPNDVLAFYTDGITEAMNDDSRQFGTGRLDDVMARCELNANDMIWAVVEAVDQFTGGQPPLDDRTLLVLQIGESPE